MPIEPNHDDRGLVDVDPELLEQVAARLDALAGRVSEMLDRTAESTQLPAAAADEVSTSAARALGVQAETLSGDLRDVRASLADDARRLREHAGGYSAADAANAASIGEVQT